MTMSCGLRKLTCKAFKGSQQLVALGLDEGQLAFQRSCLTAVALCLLLQRHILS